MIPRQWVNVKTLGDIPIHVLYNVYCDTCKERFKKKFIRKHEWHELYISRNAAESIKLSRQRADKYAEFTKSKDVNRCEKWSAYTKVKQK